MNDNLDELLSMMESQADSVNYDSLDSFEQTESYEVENLLVRRGYDRARARRIAPSVSRNHSVKARLRAATSAGLRHAPQAQGQPAKYSAQFDITAKRLTNTIAADLPFALFGAIEAEAAFASFIELPAVAGLSLTVSYGVHDAEPNKMKFDYFDGVNRDIIEVTCAQVPYPMLLKSMETDLMQINNFKYVLSDPTQAPQFSKELAIKTRSMFGKSEKNTISLESYFSKNQFQAGLREVPIVIDLDKETAIVNSITQVAGLGVTFSCFVNKFDRTSARGKW